MTLQEALHKGALATARVCTTYNELYDILMYFAWQDMENAKYLIKEWEEDI